ncbi:MAG: terminase gpA endonuclease subunit, partial [Parvularcula sp.]|nr:terminase gpA endonuclease subunit [Parvularcula sp.]
IVAAVQASKTTAAELTLCYIIANLPGPTLWLNETDEDAKDQSESRLQKLFEICEPVRRLFPANRHKRRNLTIHFANEMTLWFAGAHNKTNLQRRSIRWIIGDECWNWPTGHMAEAEARVTAFGWLGKCIWMSQAGVEDDDLHRKFETTDMREWTFSCPVCGHRQPFRWENVEWASDCKDDQDQYDFRRIRATTRLVCEHCRHEISDTDEQHKRLNATGAFVPQNSNAAAENVGFHWNSLASMSWGKLAELYLRAKLAARRGDTTLLQQFYQKRLALPWREIEEDFKVEVTTSGYRLGDPWDDEAALDARGKLLAAPFPKEHSAIPLRFLSIDVQMDHFWLVVRSWSAEGASRLLWCQKALTWEELEAVQTRFRIHDNLVFVDAGYNSYEVYRQCARHGWTALMGDRRETFAHNGPTGSVLRFYSTVRKVFLAKGSICRMHYFAANPLKDLLARLRRHQNPETGASWEIPEDVPAEYLQHLEGEHRVKKAGKWVWEQIGDRPNHLLDCEVMQVCAATMLKIAGREAVECPAKGEGKASASR